MSPRRWLLLLTLCLQLTGAVPQRGAPASVDCELKPQVIFALNQTHLQQESPRAGNLQIPCMTEDLIEHYNCGDLSSVIFSHDSSQVPNFINAVLPPQECITAQGTDSYFSQKLIYKRNERMRKWVKTLLEDLPDKGFFFAFGAERRVNIRHRSPPPLAFLVRKHPHRRHWSLKLGGQHTHCLRPCVTAWKCPPARQGTEEVSEEVEVATVEAEAPAVQ